MHPEVEPFLTEVVKKFKPTEVVFLGDIIDLHGVSFHPQNPDIMSASDELTGAIEQLKPLYKKFPNAKLCLGNHDRRPFRKAADAGIPSAFIKTYEDFLELPEGWEVGDKFFIDNIRYEHGESCAGNAGGAYRSCSRHRQSVVYGHWHSFAGITYSATERDLIWGFNTGCLIDPHALAFAYGKTFPNKPVLGCGIIIDGIPFFIPMNLGSRIEYVK